MGSPIGKKVMTNEIEVDRISSLSDDLIHQILSFLHTRLPSSFALPALKSLHLVSCELPETVWDLPALVSLVLADVDVPVDISNYLCVLVNLRSSLTEYSALTPNILIFAPKLCNLIILGIFTITCGASKLENVTIKLRGSFGDENTTTWEMLNQYSRRIMFMLPGLGSARTLTLDEDTVEVLSSVASLLERSSSPFYNLKYVKLPHRYTKSGAGLSGTTKSYLLGASSGASIVSSFPQDNVIPRITPFSPTAQDVMQEDPRASPPMELNDSQGIHKKVCSDSLTMKVKEEHGVDNSRLFDRKVGQVGTLLQGFGGVVPLDNDQTSSSRGITDFGLWQGHEVKSEFLGLLELIMEKYPETFDHFTTKSNSFCSMKLIILCTSISAFITTAMTEINTEMITEYRALFSYLQSSFNLQWLVNHLNYIEQLLISQHELPEHFKGTTRANGQWPACAPNCHGR
ncbi:hypothetical protein POM88_002679 [Heracleum sosnowskyi]|uniref:Uncharacterized protein n=1 Tax=Heracleum sosnowskyi TaxID=360622 RepID=A0AAD8JF64_9APIA|nr:hypothetical protein POM88_002679 [Heracleum sosnowskyi]